MEIKRNDPPGRSNRKLLGYLAELTQLHSEGYSIAGICKVFSDSGVVIGWSTVQREVARLNQKPAATTTSSKIPEVAGKTPAPVELTDGTTVLLTKKKIATEADVENFFRTHVSNPLLKRHLKP